MNLDDSHDNLCTAIDKNWTTVGFEQQNDQFKNNGINVLDQTIDDWTMSETSQKSTVSTAYDSHDPIDNTDRLTKTAPVKHDLPKPAEIPNVLDLPETIDSFDSHDIFEDPDRLTYKTPIRQDLPDTDESTFDSHDPLDDPDRLENKPLIKRYLPYPDKPFFWINSNSYYNQYRHDN